MTVTSTGPTGRDWGEMVGEVKHLKEATTMINLKLDELPDDIVSRINTARADCRHIRTSVDQENRLRGQQRDISSLQSDLSGMKRVTATITTAISMAIGAVGLALKWHK